MSSENKNAQHRTLSLVVATVMASGTSIGCGEMHQASDAALAVDAPMTTTDASPVDAGSIADAPPPLDAPSLLDGALALDAAPAQDAFFADDDADLPDGHYPDGVRG